MGQFHRNKNQRGETLVESLLALAVATVIATGIVIAVVTALSGTTNNQNSNFAGNYAQEGSNLVKDLAATDFTSFQSTYVYNSSDTSKNVYNFGDDQTLRNNSSTFVPCSGSSSPTYNLSDSSGNCSLLRTVYINTSGCDLRKGGQCSDQGKTKCVNGVFTATAVSWSDSKCRLNANCHSAEIDSCLTNLNVLPTP